MGKDNPTSFQDLCVHDVENQTSGKVMVKCGLSLEGVLKRHTIFPNRSDEPRDVVIYAWARPEK